MAKLGLPKQRKTLSIFSSDPAFRSELAGSLERAGVYATTEADSASFVAARGNLARSDVIVLDVGDGVLLDDPRLATVRERHANVPFFVVSEALSADRTRQVVRLQARDWLQKPFNDTEFLATLTRFEAAANAEQSRVTTVIGATGGAGATTMALMTMAQLAKGAPDGAVALADLDFQTASSSSYLNVQSEFDIDAIAANPERLDVELLDTIKLHHAPNMALYSFERPLLNFSPVAKRFVLGLLDLLSARYRDVVVDLPNLATPWFDDVVRHSDCVVVVFEVNIPSMRLANRLLRRITEIRGSQSGVRALANKASFKLFGNSISRRDVTKLLGVDRFDEVVRDDALLIDSLNRAMLPTEIAGRSNFVRQTHRFLNKALGARK